ncbi:hypothetical protein F2Q69_00042901 [Brassica cretica]|uniref:Uncharacterized protein n=1 Tax=Brassica cretica TaxID=69181 RepID=A0A8S9NEK9_BRACR|nr:hypothetical protein F2Q69_00042901 [Brassica cretica]
MEGTPYRKFSVSRRKEGDLGTGPRKLHIGEPGFLLVGIQGSFQSPFSSRTRTKVATLSRGSVSINVQDEVLIDVGWKISVDGRVASVDGG